MYSYGFSTATIVARTRLSVTLYVHSLFCFTNCYRRVWLVSLPSIAHVVMVDRNSQYVIFITLITAHMLTIFWNKHPVFCMLYLCNSFTKMRVDLWVLWINVYWKLRMLQLRRSTVTGTKFQNNGLLNFYFQHILSRRLNQWTRTVRRSDETEIFLPENLPVYKSLSTSRHYKVIFSNVLKIWDLETDLFCFNTVLIWALRATRKASW